MLQVVWLDGAQGYNNMTLPYFIVRVKIMLYQICYRVAEVPTPEYFENYKDPCYDKMIARIVQKPLSYSLWREKGETIFRKTGNKYKILADSDSTWKIEVPKSHRNQMLKRHHDTVTSGQCGIFKTYHRIYNYYYWPKMKFDIRNYIDRSSKCIAFKPAQKLPLGQMRSRPDITKPWELITVDRVGPLLRSSQGYKY